MTEKERFVKEVCVACKRIVTQYPITFDKQKPISTIICIRCSKEHEEFMNILESYYGHNPAWLTTPESMEKARKDMMKGEEL